MSRGLRERKPLKKQRGYNPGEDQWMALPQSPGKPPSSDDDGWSQYEWGKNDIIEMIEKIVETYADKEWAFIYEPLQNAFDSFYVSDSSTATNGYVVRTEYNVKLVIDPTNNRITIQDNGSGWNRNNIKTVFMPFTTTKSGKGKTLKDKRQKGAQGVGIKTALYQSDLIKITSTDKGKSEDDRHWEASFNKFGDYTEPGYKVPNIQNLIKITSKGPEHGTIIEITPRENNWVADYVLRVVDEYIEDVFGDEPDEEIRKSILEKTKLTTILERRLKLNSYLGDLMYDSPDSSNLPKIKFKITIKKCKITGLPELKKAQSDTTSPGMMSFLKSKYNSIKPGGKPTLMNNPESALNQGQGTNSRIFMKYLSKDELLELCRGVKRIKDASKTNAYELETTPPDGKIEALIQSHVNGMLLVMGNADTIRKNLTLLSRLDMSAYGLPTDIGLKVKKGGERTYLQGVYAILDVEEPVGIGKRNMESRRIGTYNSLLTHMWPKWIQPLAKVVIGDPPSFDPPAPPVQIDIAQIPESSGRYDLSKIGMANEPQREQDVIFAFGHYLGQRDDNPLLFYQHNERTEFDAAGQITEENIEASLRGKNLVIEYKYSIKDYLSSFSESKQLPQDFQILIVWKDETTLHQLDEYNFARITSEQDKPTHLKRDFWFNQDLVSFRLHQTSNGHTFGVIVLSELIQIDEEE